MGPKGRRDLSLGCSVAEAQEWFFVRERALKARAEKTITVGVELVSCPQIAGISGTGHQGVRSNIPPRFQRGSAFLTDPGPPLRFSPGCYPLAPSVLKTRSRNPLITDQMSLYFSLTRTSLNENVARIVDKLEIVNRPGFAGSVVLKTTVHSVH
jgi:hypothetical protein